jgi:hypothetical protein
MDDFQVLFDHWYLHVPICFLVSLIFLILVHHLQDSQGSKLPTINGKGFFELSDKRMKQNYVLNGRRLLREGLERFGGRPFRILTDHGPTTILSPDYAHEIRNNEGLDHVKAIAKVGLPVFYHDADCPTLTKWHT